MIEARWEYGHITIRIDNKFYCTCDNWKEVEEEIARIKKERK